MTGQNLQTIPDQALSTNGLKAATKTLDTDARVTGYTALVPVEVCQEIIDLIDASPLKSDRNQARELFDRMMRNYPGFVETDHPDYAIAICELLQCYPPRVGHRATGHDGIAGKKIYGKYPTTPDLKACLDAEMTRRANIRANAVWHQMEAKRRVSEAQERREFDRQRPDLEARKAQVARLLGSHGGSNA